jgi:hypothetical protein
MVRDSIAGRVKYFSFLQNFQNGCRDHPTTIQSLQLCLFPGVKWPGRESDHSLPASLPRLRMRGAVPLLLLYAFMACTTLFCLYHFCLDFVRIAYDYQQEKLNIKFWDLRHLNHPVKHNFKTISCQTKSDAHKTIF